MWVFYKKISLLIYLFGFGVDIFALDYKVESLQCGSDEK